MLRTSVNSFYGKRNFNKNIWERCCQSCGEIEKRGHGNLHRCKEAVPQKCSVKKVFSEISQNSQQNICTKVSFSLKKRLWRRCFPVNFMKFLRTPFLQNNSGRLVLDAFASEICQPVEPQNINLAQYQFDHLKNFDLANYNSKRLQMNIDLLIGSQDYWNFIGYKQVLGKSGLIAIFSRLGFVLSGPCANEQNDAILQLNLLIHIYCELNLKFIMLKRRMNEHPYLKKKLLNHFLSHEKMLLNFLM